MIKPRLTTLATLSLATVFIFSLLAWRTAEAAAYTITPDNMQGWMFGFDSGANGTGQMAIGPGTPPAGSGSAQLTVSDTTTGMVLQTGSYYTGTRLSDITALSYSTYRTSGAAAQTPSFQFAYDQDITDGITAWQGRLVYEPYLNGSPATGSWQTWDALNGGAGLWWASPNATSTVDDACPMVAPCTWNTIITTFPDIAIHPLIPQMLFKAGSGWSSFDGNVDNFSITVNGVTDTFNFEPLLVVHNITQGTSYPTIQLAVNAADPHDEIEIDPGIFNEQVVINKALTLRGAGVGTTILDGNNKSGTGGVGISLASNVDDVHISDLSITQYRVGILRAANLPAITANIVIEDVNSSDNHEAGIWFSGSSPAHNIRLTRITANNNNGNTFIGRGIFMQSHDKENIIIEDGTFLNNRISGIDLNIGALDGVRITGNTVGGNNVAHQVVDSGIGILGLVNSGNYANEISGNTVSVHGRFGIEIKGTQSSGSLSGLGSLLIISNTVSHANPGVPLNLNGAADNRDLAGIAVGNINTSGNTAGVILQNNTVSGFRQYAVNTTPDPDTSTGFCISISGLNYVVTGNDVDNCDVGIQEQQGFLGDQNSTGDEYFGRDNGTIACGVVSGNTFGTNTVNARQVGIVSLPTVNNVDSGESFCTIQSAIDAGNTLASHTIVPSAQTYTETVTVGKGVILVGANAGTAGNATRVTETTIAGGSGTAVTISADNATLDGFHLTGAIGVALGDYDAALIENNLIETNVLGVQVQGNSNPFTLADNAITLSTQVGAQQTIGIFLNGLSGATAPTIANNDVEGAFYAYLLHAVNTTAATSINGGAISGVMQGIAVVNTLDNATYFPSTFAAEGVTMSAFAGDYTGIPALSPFNFHAGVYVFTGGSDSNASVTGTLTNLDIQETGKISADSAALYLGDFSTAVGTMQAITADGVALTNNLNRGVSVRGANAAVLVQNSTITDNGTDPFTTGGNDGYAVIVRNGASVTVQNSTIANPAAQVSGVAYAFHTSGAGSNLLVRGNDISTGNIFQTTSGTSLTAYANHITNFATANLPGAGNSNARHNWWGSYTTQPTGVNADSWAYRLGAPVAEWGEGTLGEASLTSAGGTGTGILVSHGRGLANVPFGKGIAPYANQMCSDYYDLFVVNGAGDWTATVPVDNTAACDEALTEGGLFHMALAGTAPDTNCVDGLCWEIPTGVVAGTQNLAVTVDAAQYLAGTPFVAGPNPPDYVVANVELGPDQAQSGLPSAVLTYTIAITNTGDTTGTMLLTLSNEWVVSYPSSVDDLGAGDSTTFDVTITVPADALAGDMDTAVLTATVQGEPNNYDTITLTSTAEAVYGVSASGTGLLLGLPGTTVTHTVTITNEGNAPDTFDVALGAFAWDTALGQASIALAAGATGTVDVTVAIPADALFGDNDSVVVDVTSQGDDTQTADVTLETEAGVFYAVSVSGTGTLGGLPGTTVTHTVTITNNGNTSDTFDVALGTADWNTVLGQGTITLAAGASGIVAVTVDVPAEAQDGEQDSVVVDVTSQGDDTQTAATTLTTQAGAVYAVSVTGTGTLTGEVGTTVTHTVTITNDGNASDTFEVSAGTAAWPTALGQTSITLAAGESGTVQVVVTIPATADDGQMDSVVVSVTSQGDDTQTAAVTLTTVAEVTEVEPPLPTIYLPLIMRP